MTNNTAAQIAADYFAAWSTKDVNKATDYLTDDVQIVAPNGTFSGHSGYHEFMDGFVAMLTGVSEFTVFGDENTALVWYDTHLQPVPTLTAGERVTIRADKIARIEITFDQMPLAQAFGGQVPAHRSTGARPTAPGRQVSVSADRGRSPSTPAASTPVNAPALPAGPNNS